MLDRTVRRPTLNTVCFPDVELFESHDWEAQARFGLSLVKEFGGVVRCRQMYEQLEDAHSGIDCQCGYFTVGEVAMALGYKKNVIQKEIDQGTTFGKMFNNEVFKPGKAAEKIFNIHIYGTDGDLFLQDGTKIDKWALFNLVRWHNANCWTMTPAQLAKILKVYVFKMRKMAAQLDLWVPNDDMSYSLLVSGRLKIVFGPRHGNKLFNSGNFKRKLKALIDLAVRYEKGDD